MIRRENSRIAGPRLLAALFLMGAVWASPSLEAQPKKGLDAFTAGDYEQAIPIFKAAAQGGSEKDRFVNYYFLGMAYHQIRQLPEAIAAFEDSLKHKDNAREYYAFGFLFGCYGDLGQVYLEDKQYQQAGSNFMNAASVCLNMSRIKSNLLNPDPARWERVAGNYYGLLGRAHVLDTTYQEAVTAYKRAMELDPMNGLHYSGLALAYVGLRQYDDALAGAKRGVELAANSQDSYASLGDVQAARKEYGQAIEAYRKAVEVAPLQLADQVNEQKNAGAAPSQRVYDQMGEALNTASAGFSVKSSQMFIAKGDYGGAAEAIAKAIELTPKDPDLYYRLGVIQARSGKFDEAVASLDRAIGMVTFTGIGIQIRIEGGQPVVQRQVEGDPGLMEGPAREAGLKAGDRLVNINGQPTKGWDANKISQSLRGDENTQVVLLVQRKGEAKPFEKAITRKMIIPKTAAGYYGSRGLYAREKGNREDAVKDATLAYSLDPENIDAREALAALSLDGGKYDEAINLLSTLKDNPLARILEATAYARQNDYNRAVAIYLAIPEDDVSATALRQSAKKTLGQVLQGYIQQRLDRARASESAGRFIEALDEYSEAVNVADEATAGVIRQRAAILLKNNPYLYELPEEARKYALRGDVFIKDGEFEEALKEYRTALGFAPFNPKLHFNAALIHGQLKDYHLAIKYMAIYLQLNPDAPDARAAKDEIYKWELSLEREGKR
jgi:tetratricopeptide (TPR) repeat protein